jgi:hypothetical protein
VSCSYTNTLSYPPDSLCIGARSNRWFRVILYYSSLLSDISGVFRRRGGSETGFVMARWGDIER